MSAENPNPSNPEIDEHALEAQRTSDDTNERLGFVNTRIRQIQESGSAVDQETVDAYVKGDISYHKAGEAQEARDLTLQHYQQEQKRLLKRIDNPNSLRERLGRLARRH